MLWSRSFRVGVGVLAEGLAVRRAKTALGYERGRQACGRGGGHAAARSSMWRLLVDSRGGAGNSAIRAVSASCAASSAAIRASACSLARANSSSRFAVSLASRAAFGAVARRHEADRSPVSGSTLNRVLDTAPSGRRAGEQVPERRPCLLGGHQLAQRDRQHARALVAPQGVCLRLRASRRSDASVIRWRGTVPVLMSKALSSPAARSRRTCRGLQRRISPASAIVYVVCM